MNTSPGRPMWGTEVRGVLAIAAVIVAIAVIWTRIENRTTDTETAVTTSTTTTTTTSVPATTTTSREQAELAVCERSRTFVDAVDALPDEAGDGELAGLALEFWGDLLELAPPETATEIIAVVHYYEDYMETGTPFEFDTRRIILEGDKEKLELLLTRPAPGLEAARGVIALSCGIDVPDKPAMSARSFTDLERRLLGRTVDE